MGELPLRTVLLVLLLASAPATTRAADTDEELPSAELLEFLGEMEPVDDATWRLLEHHADKDLAQNQEVNRE